MTCRICGRTLLHVLIIALGAVSHGFGIAYPSPAIPQIACYFTKFELSIFSSITALVAVLGPSYANTFMVRYGRRMTLAIVAFTAVAAWGCILYPHGDFKTLALLHRALFGLAVGAYATIVPVYIMEISPSEHRTVYGTLNQLGISFGVFICYLIGAFVDWRFLAGVGMAIPGLVCLLARWLPESPAYLHMLQERGTVMHPQGKHFTHKTWGSIVTGILLLLLQQLSAINPVQVNMSHLMQTKVGPAIAASAKLVAGFVCLPMFGLLGRKLVWLVSCLGCAGSLYMIGASYERNEVVVIASTFVFLFSFCFGLGPMPWFLIPEMFDDSIRSAATAMLTTFSPLFSFLVTFIYPYAGDFLGFPTTFTILAVTMVFGGVYGLYAIQSQPPDDILAEDSNPLDFDIDLSACLSDTDTD